MKSCSGLRWIVAITLLSSMPLPSDSFARMPTFASGKQVGALRSELITEASGIVASRRNPGVLWVHNDSGDSARVFAINAEGVLLAICRIEKAHLRDWEDVAIGPGPDPNEHYLYIGDIGDNQARRSSVTIYRVPEPKVDPNRFDVRAEIGPAEAIELEYPDGPRDAETLMVDPWTGDIYIISKRELRSRVYRAAYPQSTEKRTTMTLVATLPWGLAVAGDISPDGRLVVVRGPFNASMWERPEGEEFVRAFQGEESKLRLLFELQGEGICFDGRGLGYFTIGEMSGASINYYARLPGSDQSNN